MPSHVSSLATAFQAWGVGNTPLVEIPWERALGGEDLASPSAVRLYAKAEWVNPGGSVKDRAALGMILDGRSAGRLEGRTLLDATSGNTGIAYAWIGARLGLPVSLAVPASINPERKRVLESYGARLVLTDPLEGSDGAIRKARSIHESDPERYFYPDQYSNPANWRAHYETTGLEIWEQTEGTVTHFVAGLGTSGTMVGTGRRLRERKPSVRIVSVEPDGPFHGLEGLKHMGSAMVPSIYDRALADEKASVTTEDAQKTVRLLARRCGLLAGPSSGAAVAAAARLCRRLAAEGAPGVVVTVLPDSGERYLGEAFWREGEAP